jgi:hypothetical protein
LGVIDLKARRTGHAKLVAEQLRIGKDGRRANRLELRDGIGIKRGNRELDA